MGGFNKRNLFLTTPEAGNSEIKVLASSLPKICSPGFQMADFLLCLYLAEAESSSIPSSFFKGHILED